MLDINPKEFEAALQDEVARCFPRAEEALLNLLHIPSVAGKPEPQAPFGRAVAQALSQLAKLAAELGLTPTLTTHYLTVDLGDAAARPAETVGILSHADVVPFGEGWHYSPTGQLVEDKIEDKIYGRGALDDKGPTVAALFAMAALARLHTPLARPVRLIIGGNEESGCRCIRKYVEDHPVQPAFGFSPDANFPLIFAEKGIAMLKLSAKCAAAGTSAHIQKISAGTVVNAVPGKAEAWLGNISAESLHQQLAPKFTQELAKGLITITPTADGCHVAVLGKAAHGSMPEKGQNAAARLLLVLGHLPLDSAQLQLLGRVYNLFGRDYLGKAAGIAASDAISGPLTLNLGTLHLDEGALTLQLDMRYPVTHQYEPIFERLAQAAGQAGLAVQLTEHKAPLYVPQTEPPVQELLALYQEYEPAAQPLAIGGGTYCRAFDNFVAFGPLRESMADVMHQADEFIRREDFQFLQKIYAQAIWRLAAKA